MVRVNGKFGRPSLLAVILNLAVIMGLGLAALQAQTGSGQSQSQPPASSRSGQDIPDAPSTVQPPPPSQPSSSVALPPPPDKSEPSSNRPKEPIPFPGDSPRTANEEKEAAPSPSSAGPAPSGSTPRNQVSPEDDLYKLVVKVNFVQIPVMVKDSDGRRVDGLLPKDFTVLENGKKQTLSYFTSDPFELSVAVVIDIGMADVAVQKVNQTYSALVGAFSPYDEVALYTYSSTVSQVADFTGKSDKLVALLNQLKLVRGNNNGPPVMGGPLGQSGPMINGLPAGGGVAPVYTPPREAHVLNDAILRAALDLSKRERTRRKVIFVISNGRELGSKAGYNDVLRLLETQGIQVRAVVIDSGALPVYRQLNKIHLKDQGYSNILPKYVAATGGGNPFTELSRNAMEEAYAQITNEARNQYTLGYIPTAGATTAKREIEVIVDHPKLKIFAKDAYYATPAPR
jgi:VWFA-related protein